MSLGVKPASGMHLFYLDDAGVLFSEATQELYALNTAAAVIWSLLEDGHDARAISAHLQRECGLEAERSERFVADALAEWRGKDFLDPPSEPRLTRGNAAPAPQQRQQPLWREPAVVEERHYRILSSRFCVRFSSAEQALMVRPVIGHLEVEAPSPPETVVDILQVRERIVVYRDREGFADCSSASELAPIVKSLFWVTAVRDHEFFLSIHAGVIGDGRRCILLPAPPGSGKSTLTAALMHAGFEFFSDEVALLQEETCRVFPVPLAICIKSSGIAALADRFTDLGAYPVHRRGDGKHVIYMPPTHASRPATDEPRPVAALVFPRYTAGAPALLTALAKFDALEHLTRECLAVSTLAAAKVKTLIAWIARTPCYRLTYGSTDDAIAAIREVMARHAKSG